MLGFLSLGLIWFFWINLVFWFNLGFITLEGVVFPPMTGTGYRVDLVSGWILIRVSRNRASRSEVVIVGVIF